ncbi:MAG: type III pantothenate kinase [Saprospiraceae bacterium]|nr:type III pantothenate kinase [Saprospiraceae bacterium]
MNLALDIGNTRRKTGLFNGTRLVESRLITDWSLDDLLGYCNQTGVRNVVLSSVVDIDISLNKALTQYFGFLELTHETALPFENKYRTPQSLGKDRLAAVAGAQALLPRQHCLVVDCGTCIKYDVITASGEYLGGNIAPGAQMRAKAMHAFTARLPEVEMGMPEDFIGHSTETALQNGAFRGAALEIEGFVELFKKRFSPLQLILTGGDAAFFQANLNIPNLILEPNLTLYGLNNILIFNAATKMSPLRGFIGDSKTNLG